MFFQLDSLQKLSTQNLASTAKAFGIFTTAAHAIGREATQYSQQTFEQSASAIEKLVEAKTLDKTLELQTDYTKAACDSFLTQSKRMRELYQTLAKEAVRSVQAVVASHVGELNEAAPSKQADAAAAESTA